MPISTSVVFETTAFSSCHIVMKQNNHVLWIKQLGLLGLYVSYSVSFLIILKVLMSYVIATLVHTEHAILGHTEHGLSDDSPASGQLSLTVNVSEDVNKLA